MMIASISSKRDPSGWSKWLRPRSKLSRQRKRRMAVMHAECWDEIGVSIDGATAG
jgi:hypothetical protein